MQSIPFTTTIDICACANDCTCGTIPIDQSTHIGND